MDAPKRALVVTPHPDDAEFGCAGTLAKWIRQGTAVHYVVATDGSKGTSDLEMTPERLAAIRQQEQAAACRVLGATEVVFLGHPDGELEDTKLFRGQVVREIRRLRPEVVLTSDPFRRTFYLHRDHRICGQVTLDACYPYARDHLHYPEHRQEGLMPHKVSTILFWGTDEPREFVDIGETLATKLEALCMHTSQVDPKRVEEFLTQGARRMGELAGCQYAEGFRRMDFRP